MKILVTGVHGYLGSLLTTHLIRRKHAIVGLDTGFYREGWLYHGEGSSPVTIVKDIRNVDASDLEGMDAVVHLAELSNDPLSEFSPEITASINHVGSVGLAVQAKRAGVSRFVYMSSCSVYGAAVEQDIVAEHSPTRPQTIYAECKLRVEEALDKLAGPGFSPTSLRNATAFGASPRMRFDLVLNNLAGMAWTTREIRLTSDGTPWRPLVHALDICKAIGMILESPAEAIHNQIVNVGDTRQNYRVREIAGIVAQVFPGCQLTVGPPNGDNRSYRVSFDKIRKVLPGFRCAWAAEDGARQLLEVFSGTGMSTETFVSRPFTRLKQLKHLLDTRQIDPEFFWNDRFPAVSYSPAPALGRARGIDAASAEEVTVGNAN